MRIYNKRNFAAGILSLALAVACGVVLAVTGFQTKWLIALVLLLAAGGFDLWWSLSRESRLPRVDGSKRRFETGAGPASGPG